MNKWMQHGALGLAMASAALAGNLASKAQAEGGDNKVKAIENFGHKGIDALDYAGGSKLKDRMINSTGHSVELATVTTVLEKIKA